MLTPQERALVEDVRNNAAVTGERDTRAPSELRREQRRLIAIIDRLVPPDPQMTHEQLLQALKCGDCPGFCPPNVTPLKTSCPECPYRKATAT